MPSTEVIILLLFLVSASGFALKYLLKFNTGISNCIYPVSFTILGIIFATQLQGISFVEAITFLGAAIAQFIAFVVVSRSRQRSSFTFHTFASLASNGSWYITLNILDRANAYWPLFLLHIAGIIAGRTVGVIWSQYIEKKLGLISDATKDARLAPGQRLRVFMAEKTFWALALLLVIYVVYAGFNFSADANTSIAIVIGLGILQNFFYALTTRASQRGNNWYIVITGLAGGLVFYVSVAYLFSKDMTMALFIPYTLSTTLGSVTGAFLSMIIEWTLGIKPDEHLKEKTKNKQTKSKTPYIVVLGMASIWIIFQGPILKYFGYTQTTIVSPLPFFGEDTLPRMIIMLIASVIFLFDSAIHTLVSRAGNRNHAGYHVSACIPKGLFDFYKLRYISLNAHIPDIVPVAIIASCMGSLYGKDISERIEKWLQARMDVEENTKASAVKA
ncbi:MAG: hypothetical protein Q8Q06_00070 [bacterium]|nr:hypothetical protein [bacterium]